jgi:hypothetical protein
MKDDYSRRSGRLSLNSFIAHGRAITTAPPMQRGRKNTRAKVATW